MFPNAAPTRPTRTTLPPASPVSNWNVALYRKAESINSYDPSQPQTPSQVYGSFYIQHQQQANSSSPSRSDVLHLRYQSQQQKNSVNSYTLPFTISQLSDIKLSTDTVPVSSTVSRFYNADQQTIRINDPSDIQTTLLLRAKAFLGILVLNSSTNSTTANTAGIIRPFLIFVTEEIFVGQLFDAYIYRISQIATISLRDNPEDESYVTGIKKLFQGRCFYYSTFSKPESNNSKCYFNKPYDITLCAQRMAQGHDSDIRFFWNRGLCLPLLKYNIDVRYWIPKIMCGGIEKYSNQSNDIDLWLISRLSCERAGTRFNVRGVNDDGAVANFVETEQIVLLPRQNSYSSYVLIRGSIPIYWHQPRFQVGTHRITISRSEALGFKAFFEHFKHLYHHYGHVLIINLVEQREHEKRVGDEYRKLFNLLVKTYKQIQTNQKTTFGHLNERDFIWFDYHEQSRTVKNITPEQFVRNMLIENVQYPIQQGLKQQNVFTYIEDSTISLQKGIFRINCIDCLDRTNNVQLTIGLVVLFMQLESLKKKNYSNNLVEQLKEMWINNGDHISRIYTGTGALGQRSKAKDIQRSVGRAIQNNLRDDEKQQSVETLIYTYSKDSYLHERSVAALSTPYVISDGIILSEMFKIRQNYVRKEKIRISLGTWNINGDKNPTLEQKYPSILDAWILDGPENLSLRTRKADAIQTIGYVVDDYTKTIPDILAIGFQEICDLTATNMVWQSSVNATRWVDNVQNHFKRVYPNDEYILLGNDQLVGVCLAIFIRRDLVPFVKNIAVDSVKTGMGGKLGNKGCVAIRLVLHSTSICFICAHFTAGQNEYNERNKDYKSIMEKLQFPPPSRALWHDHIFFIGDFNYRLTIPRVQVEHFVKTEAYTPLLQYDQLKKEHTEGRVFREFIEGPVKFPPTYKYDIGSDEYDTSEKARTPSFTDRILWRSIVPDVQAKLLYYGRAEVKTSDHRPVSSMFDVEIETCDEIRMHKEYVNIYKRFSPSNAVIIFDMRAELISRKNSLIEEFESYVKRKYGLDIPIIDRFFISNQKCLSLHMFFENGEYARKVLEPKEDELPSGICFHKTLVNLNESFALDQKLNLLFADAEETMYAESTAYDLGAYQQPARESLSTAQDITVAGVARTLSELMLSHTIEDISPSLSMTSFDPSLLTGIADEESIIISTEINQQQKNEDIEELELIEDAQHIFEQRRRSHGTIIINNSDETDSTNSGSDIDLPPMSDDDESCPYNDEYQSNTKNHRSGPVKLYLKERFSDWPKDRYKKYQKYQMKKRGIQMTYGNIHTKEIKCQLKNQRKKDENLSTPLTKMTEDLPKLTSFLSLDPVNSIPSIQNDRKPEPLIKTNENEQKAKSSRSRLRTMKDKFKKTLKRTTSDINHLSVDKVSVEIPSDIIVGEDSTLIGLNDLDENRQENKIDELISFDSDHFSLSHSSSSNSLQNQMMPALFKENSFDPFHFSSKSIPNNTGTNGVYRSAPDQQSSSASTFYIDPFNSVAPPPSRQTSSPSNMFSASSSNYNNNNNQSTFYYQPSPQFVPTRAPPPVPITSTAPSIVNTAAFHQPLTLKNLSLNHINNTNEVTDLLDLGDPGSPPPSPKFDPYG